MRRPTKSEVMNIANLTMLVIIIVLLVTGCNVLSDFGQGGSRLEVTRSCTVDLRQHEMMEGGEKERVVENVRVNPDCSTEVKFEKDVGAQSIEEDLLN